MGGCKTHHARKWEPMSDTDSQPQQFGRYELLRCIARGGMGEIYLARTRGAGGFEKKVVIKRILPYLANEPEFVQKFIDEANIVTHLTHGNIVPVFDMGEEEGELYIAMEYIPGIDLSTMTKHLGKEGYLLPLDHAIFITKELCAGLYYAHSKKDDQGNNLGVVHRDISPHNLLISFSGNVKIIDFGVAKASVKLGQTRMGVIKGKLLYMAPEQAMAKGIDCRADVFSAGLCLYRMLTGHLPFEADNEFQIYNKVLTAQIAPPKELNPEIPDDLNAVVMKALERDLSKRYADAWLMHQDLERVLHRVSVGYTMNRLSEFMNEYFESYRPAPTGQRRPSGQHRATGQGSYPSVPSVNSGAYQQAHSTPPNTPPNWKPEAVQQPVYAQGAGDPALMNGRTVPINSADLPPMPGPEPVAPSIPSPEELGFKPRNSELVEEDHGYDADPTIDMQLDEDALARMAEMAKERRKAAGIEEPAHLAVTPEKKSKLPLILGGLAIAAILLVLIILGALFAFSQNEGGEGKPTDKPPVTKAENPDKVASKASKTKKAPSKAKVLEAFQAAIPGVAQAHMEAYNKHSATVKVRIETEPAGATVYNKKRKKQGITPRALELPRDEDTVEFSFKLEGYKKGSTEVVPSRDRKAKITLEARKARNSKSDGKPPKKKKQGDLLEPW